VDAKADQRTNGPTSSVDHVGGPKEDLADMNDMLRAQGDGSGRTKLCP